ncbi:MAG: MIP/aquaporin family protein [Mycoplasmatales bacterium]
MDEITVIQIFFAEVIGTALLIFLGTSTCAANALEKSPARNSGWIFIALGWGFAVMAGALISTPISGGHLNPAVSLAFLLTGDITIGLFVVYVIAQIIGAMLGAWLTYIIYLDYFKVQKDGNLLTVFATAPTIKNIPRNFLTETIGTFILVVLILATTLYTDLAPIFVPLVVVVIGISIGNVTGYAINPARDFGPRLIYQLCVKNKNRVDADWSYQLVPILGPLLGSALAVLVFTLLV